MRLFLANSAFRPTKLSPNTYFDIGQLAGGLSLSSISNIANSSNNLVQATGGNQGVTAANSQNMLTGLSFDGSTTNYTFQLNNEIANGNNVSLAFVITPTNLTGRFVLYSTRDTNTGGQWQLEIGALNAITNGISITGPNTVVVQANNCLTLNTPAIIIYTRTGNTHHIYVNGVDQTLVSTTPTYVFLSYNNIKRVGVSNVPGTLTNFYTGLFYVMVGANYAFSSQQVSALQAYLHNEWSI